MKITFRIKPHEQPRDESIDTEDLGFSDRHWQQMDEETREQHLQAYIEEIEQPFWIVDKIYKADQITPNT